MREQRQAEAVEAYMQSDRRSILYCAPRFGKIKTSIDILHKLDERTPMIIAPRKDIFKGWLDDMIKFKAKTAPEFVTFAGIKKLQKLENQFIILDEPHELSVNQQRDLAKVAKGCPILGLTGTLTNKTRNELYDNLNLDVCYTYSIAQAVEEGILADYQIYVHRVPLDAVIPAHGKKKAQAESRAFQALDYVRKQSDNPKTKHLMMLKQINFLQNSETKRAFTQKLLEDNKGIRILVFCGTTEVADNLGVPAYHSKAREKELFLDFCVGGGQVEHLATIKMMQAGVTIKPIHVGIINYMSGNPEDSAQKICRFLGFEYDNPEKKAEIHIISSDEDFELSRLKTGLAFFDESKITYV